MEVTRLVLVVNFLLWFYVNKNLCYLRQSPENFVFDLVRKQMSFAHGQFSVDNNVKVYIETESHFTNEALVQSKDMYTGSYSARGTLSLIRVAASDAFIPSDGSIDELFPKLWRLNLH